MTISIDKLKNGIRVITEEIPSIESVSVGIWINAGSRNEKKKENGIAHFLEHMAFKGTEKRSALQIAEEIENVGGFINAYTSREITCYYAKVLKDHLPLAVDILSDIISNSIFNEKEIEIEKGVIIQEIGQMKDTPDDVIFELLQREAYADTQLGRSILGSEENIKSFKRKNFTDFIENNYFSEKLEFSTLAMITNGVITELMKRSFGRVRPNGGCCKSFPSGHTSHSFTVATIANELYGNEIGLAAYSLAALVATSRIHDNKHYLSDVIFGAALGTAIGRGFALGYQDRLRNKNANHPIEEVGEKLRSMMPWIGSNKLVDKGKN